MALEVFTYRPINDTTRTKTFRVLTAQFGDGYKQEVADGINNGSESWPLTFVGSLTELSAIEAFFDRHQGYKAFLWKPFGSDEELAFKVKQYTRPFQGGAVWTMQATFEQDFKP